jgi:hypothetical protein
MSDGDRLPISDEQRRALETWSNVGAPGPAPAALFMPDERLRDGMTAMVRPRMIPIAWHFSSEDANRLRRGHQADSMDDKWNIWCEDDVVHFHRSWKGQEIFRIQLVDDGVYMLLVETDPLLHHATEDDGEVLRRFTEVLHFVLHVAPQPLENDLDPR